MNPFAAWDEPIKKNPRRMKEKNMTSEASHMKVAIAKDVVAQLDAGKYEAETGVFVTSSLICDEYESWEGDLRDYLTEIEGETCYVCALGACIVSKARLYDQVAVDELFKYRTKCVGHDGGNMMICNDDFIRHDLGVIFGRDQVCLMETAFERMKWDMQAEVSFAAIEFGFRYNDPQDRLRAIMQNVIDNDGIFIP